MTISEASLRDRLKNLALTQNRSVNDVLKQLYLERFLARLSRSEYSDNFIFKGGNLLSYYLELGRETKDLDFLVTKLRAEEPTLEVALRNIAAIDTGDGFAMAFIGMKILEQTHMEYPGFRATISIHFIKGTLKDNLQVDLGIGDVVNPEMQDIDLLKHKDSPFFETSLSLLVYPPETIFAEKLETVISKGGLYSRMNDYHDLVLMSREPDFLDTFRMFADIEATFKHRDTDRMLPLDFVDEDYERLDAQWLRHLRGLGDLAEKLKLPAHIQLVVQEVNDFLRHSGVIGGR